MQILHSVHVELFHLVTYLSSNSPIKHLLINRSTVVMRQFDGLRVMKTLTQTSCGIAVAFECAQPHYTLVVTSALKNTVAHRR